MGATLNKKPMSRRKRWTIGIAVGALVGLLGVLVYNVSGGVEADGKADSKSPC